MHGIVRLLRASLQLSIAVVIGVLLIVLRYIIKTPQLLTSKIAGEPRFYTWNGSKVFFQVAGPLQAPALLLVHTPEIGGSAYEMRKLLPVLAERYRVYVPDLPGFGLSDRPAQTYRASTYQAFLQSFLREVIAQPTTLVASGLSARLSLALAHSHPESIHRLILLTPLSHLQDEQQPVSAQSAVILHNPVGAFSIYAFLASKPILRRIVAWQHQQSPETIDTAELNYFYASTHQPGAEHAASAWLAGDLHTQLPSGTLPRPTLLIQGASYTTSLDQPDETNLQIANITEAGLRPHEEQPEQVLAQILHWLDPSSSPESPTANTLKHPEDALAQKQEQIAPEQETLQPLATPLVEEEISLSEASEPEIEAYCVKCKQKRRMLQPQPITTKNGRRAMEGICPVCNTRLFRFI